MGNVFDYLDWRGDISFDECAPNEVDSLILSWMSYLDLGHIVPASISAKGRTLISCVRKYIRVKKEQGAPLVSGLIMPPESIKLAVKTAKSPRFSCLRLVGHVNKIDEDEAKQFSATTYLLGDNACFVVFRGTDDTIVGWRESLSMSFMSPIPAQVEALEYIESLASAYPERKIYIGGHSKGGNLSVYAAVKCSDATKERIVRIYNLDGPGFDKEFIASEDYLAVRERIQTIVPQSSIIGMLLEHEENYEVVQSNQTGLFQHNGLSWEIMGGRFVHIDSVTEESKKIDVTIKKWLSEISPEERKRILDAFYNTLTSTNCKTLTDINADKLKVIKAWGTLDDDSKRFIKKMVSLIVKKGKVKEPKVTDEVQETAADEAQENADNVITECEDNGTACAVESMED